MLKFIRKNVLPVFGFSYKKNYGEVIEDFMEHVKQHGRAIAKNGICKYYTKNGNMCAIGQNCKNPKSMDRKYGSVNTFYMQHSGSSNSEILKRFLKNDVKHLDFEFWKELQEFHDDDTQEIWKTDNRSLTKDGEHKLKLLKRKWS